MTSEVNSQVYGDQQKRAVYISCHAFELHYSGVGRYVGLDTAIVGSPLFISVVDYTQIDDMQPGTGDVPLSVFQSIPVDGLIIVVSPQELVGMIVEKAINMA